MPEIKDRLDSLTARINDDAFLGNKGLSNEVGIHIFCYDPSDELLINHYVQRLKSMGNLKANIIEYDLYDIFLDICNGKKIMDKLPEMEYKKGSKVFLSLVSKFATPAAFVKRMQADTTPGKDVILVTGVGKVYPYMRTNNILENLQPLYSEIPIVVMYPGTYTGQQLIPFNKKELARNYYRAFNII